MELPPRGRRWGSAWSGLGCCGGGVLPGTGDRLDPRQGGGSISAIVWGEIEASNTRHWGICQERLASN